MVDEYVGGANDAIALCLHAVGIVVIFEHTNPELLVQRADRIINPAAQGHTKHREHVNVRDFTVAGPTLLPREGFHFTPGSVRNLDPRFVPYEIR